MAENCTLYCEINRIEEAHNLLSSYFPKSAPPSIGDSAETMIVRGDTGSLRCSAKHFRERGDDFCRLLLGTRAFVERMTFEDDTIKKTILDQIVSTNLAIGMVAEPAFNADERFLPVVFAIAKALDGVVFNGQEVFDALGKSVAAI